MKAVQIKSFGQPLGSGPMRRPAGPGRARRRRGLGRASSRADHPSDVIALSAQYGILPKLPAVPGNEGLVRVLAVGSSVTTVKVGDTVLLPAGAGRRAKGSSVPAAQPGSHAARADKLQLRC